MGIHRSSPNVLNNIYSTAQSIWHIKNSQFIPTDLPNGAKITLTPDGSHLDSTLYPYDLMNTSLKPGIRKLPSALDLSILNALWS